MAGAQKGKFLFWEVSGFSGFLGIIFVWEMFWKFGVRLTGRVHWLVLFGGLGSWAVDRREAERGVHGEPGFVDWVGDWAGWR